MAGKLKQQPSTFWTSVNGLMMVVTAVAVSLRYGVGESYGWSGQLWNAFLLYGTALFLYRWNWNLNARLQRECEED